MGLQPKLATSWLLQERLNDTAAARTAFPSCKLVKVSIRESWADSLVVVLWLSCTHRTSHLAFGLHVISELTDDQSLGLAELARLVIIPLCTSLQHDM